MNTSTNNHLDYPPIVAGSWLDTYICFTIGELDREQLEETAANAGVVFDTWTSEDDLRANLIETARRNGGIQIYDEDGGCLTLGLEATGTCPTFDPTAEVPIPGPRGSKPEYYIWTDAGNCDNKTTDLLEAVKWRNEFRAEGEGGNITDADNNVLSDAEILALLVVEKFGVGDVVDGAFTQLFLDATGGLKEYYGEQLDDGDVVAGLKIIARSQFVETGDTQKDYESIRDCIEKYLVASPDVEVADVLMGIQKAVRNISDPLIKATLENNNGSEDVEFHASDVLAHHMPDSKHAWGDLSEQDQLSFAEDYALWAFKRKFGDHAEYRVDIEIVAD